MSLWISCPFKELVNFFLKSPLIQIFFPCIPTKLTCSTIKHLNQKGSTMAIKMHQSGNALSWHHKPEWLPFHFTIIFMCIEFNSMTLFHTFHVYFKVIVVYLLCSLAVIEIFCKIIFWNICYTLRNSFSRTSVNRD